MVLCRSSPAATTIFTAAFGEVARLLLIEFAKYFLDMKYFLWQLVVKYFAKVQVF